MNQTRFETWLFAFSRGFSLSLFPMWKETKGTVLLNLSNQRDGINSNNPWHELILNFSRLSPLLPQTIMEAWSQKAELSNGSSSCVRQTAKRTSSLLNLVSGFHLYSGKITPSFKSLPQVLSVSTLDCNWSPLIFFFSTKASCTVRPSFLERFNVEVVIMCQWEAGWDLNRGPCGALWVMLEMICFVGQRETPALSVIAHPLFLSLDERPRFHTLSPARLVHYVQFSHLFCECVRS